MAITIESGIVTAKNMANRDTSLYAQADNKFHGSITPYLGDAPLGIALGHLLRVNRKLLATPEFTKDRRRGFLLATINMAREADIAWENLDDAIVCGYVWGRDINSSALSIYTTNPDLFSNSDADFWRCAYLKHTLGDAAFSIIWKERKKNTNKVYDGLIYAVNIRKRGLPGWNIIQLKHTVLVGCEYVFQLAHQSGTVISDGYGIQPVLNSSQMRQVYS